MAGKDAIEVEAADHDIREILATVQDQGRQTLELLGRVTGHDLTTVEDLRLLDRMPFRVDGRKLRRGVTSCFR